MSSLVEKSNSPKPKTRQSYATPPIPPSKFLLCPSFTSLTFSSNRPQERSPLVCSPNPFEPLSPNPTPTTRQTYASPPPLKTPFNIVASSFPPLTSTTNQSKYRPSTQATSMLSWFANFLNLIKRFLLLLLPFQYELKSLVLYGG